MLTWLMANSFSIYELMQFILLVNETLIQCNGANFSGWGHLPHISNTLNRNSDCWEMKKTEERIHRGAEALLDEHVEADRASLH